MVKIKLEKDFISIKGHSGYDESGKDIVCASVSSIAITSINALLKYDAESIEYKKDDGLIELTILKHDKVIDILLDNMISLFKELEMQYKKYINVKED